VEQASNLPGLSSWQGGKQTDRQAGVERPSSSPGLSSWQGGRQTITQDDNSLETSVLSSAAQAPIKVFPPSFMAESCLAVDRQGIRHTISIQYDNAAGLSAVRGANHLDNFDSPRHSETLRVTTVNGTNTKAYRVIDLALSSFGTQHHVAACVMHIPDTAVPHPLTSFHWPSDDFYAPPDSNTDTPKLLLGAAYAHLFPSQVPETEIPSNIREQFPLLTFHKSKLTGKLIPVGSIETPVNPILATEENEDPPIPPTEELEYYLMEPI
jgi:hypothetical protein